MQLSQTAEYALRAMAVLANVGPGQVVRSTDLAAVARIPPHYVSKVMRALVCEGVVDSRKGHHGGFRLSRPASEIRVADVLHAIDSRDNGPECAFGWARCNPDKPCPLHGIWSRMREGFREWAEGSTLDQVGGVEHLLEHDDSDESTGRPAPMRIVGGM